jgi:hypothetical protein
MLAKRRSLKLNGVEVERTPLLVPSFSSKGFPDVHKIIESCSELIEGVTLVSAYDLHYDKVRSPFDFPSLIFLDSGGYEASKDTELSDLGDRDHHPKDWTQEMHEAIVAKWRPSVPSVIISYDHPKARVGFVEQIERARGIAPGRTDFLRELLLKPEKESQTLLHVDEMLRHVHRFADFDIIGVTEKEIGNSLVDRMKNIAKLRRALAAAGIDIPIHVFGSLDTISSPMYFLAGADIFDGLTWLRFAFHEGLTIYKHNFGALQLGVTTKAHMVDARCWYENYYYMNELELEMRRFLASQDFGSFKYHGDMFKTSLESALEALGDL